MRKRVLAEERECRLCGADATQVDHITPKARGGSDERWNLRALCVPCHRAKTSLDAALARARASEI